MSLRQKYLALILAIFIIELLVATTLAQIRFIRGSISDFLVVALIYFSVQAIKPLPPLRLAIGVFLFACLVEISQYFHLADQLPIPPGGVVHILLGNTFSLQDIAMYLLGSIAAYGCDRWLCKSA
ncbi:MAG: DUF2809 domain-containing protein [Pseudomonadota bacterium]